MGSALLAMEFGFMGANYSISTACATSNYCFHAAANHIRRGEADVMVAGGSEATIIPIAVGGFIACRALSRRNDDPKTASRPWDKDRDGFVMGEGSGVLVICVSSCLLTKMFCIQVNYINAHATSTVVGDLAEINAAKQVFKNPSEIKMNATKFVSMIDSFSFAANYRILSQRLSLIQLPTKSSSTKLMLVTTSSLSLSPFLSSSVINILIFLSECIHAAISNSFGFGGHNSVVVFAPFKP
ncbi:hypothetical protein GW17_00039817 [Ensete ventricosum]|nr:hypothetical protein GW17_00039817 [Ensete ventricosum]